MNYRSVNAFRHNSDCDCTLLPHHIMGWKLDNDTTPSMSDSVRNSQHYYYFFFSCQVTTADGPWKAFDAVIHMRLVEQKLWTWNSCDAFSVCFSGTAPPPPADDNAKLEKSNKCPQNVPHNLAHEGKQDLPRSHPAGPKAGRPIQMQTV